MTVNPVWNTYLVATSGTAAVVQTTAANAALAVFAACSAALLASNSVLTAAATVRPC
jgi:hypothetical protein